MSSLFFYLIIILIITAVGWLFFYQRRQKKKCSTIIKHEPIIDLNIPRSVMSNKPREQSAVATDVSKSAYDPNIIVLQIRAFPDKPFMGYELLQTLLSLDMQFGAMNIFHRYANKKDNTDVLFSIAAATSDGAFNINDMGAFKCSGLVMFMKLDAKQKLMGRFDLMLDVARQLVEELGGEIYDDLQQPISAAIIRRLRERICTIETSNLYVADLLDNLD